MGLRDVGMWGDVGIGPSPSVALLSPTPPPKKKRKKEKKRNIFLFVAFVIYIREELGWRNCPFPFLPEILSFFGRYHKRKVEV